jgi:hypothetical protein
LRPSRFRVPHEGIVKGGQGDKTITWPLEPQKQAKLIAVAESKGMTADELVSQAIDKIIAEAPEAAARKAPEVFI